MINLGSTDNHYRLAINEINKLRGAKKFRLLEIGAGPKMMEGFLPPNITYHSMDSCPDFWKTAHTFNHDLNSGKFPIKNESYEILVCNETLEHVMYPERVIEEIKRIAKKDAIFFFSIPNEYNFLMRLYYMLAIKTKTEEPFKVVEKGLHVHKPRVKDILDLFERHFKIEKVDYVWQSRQSENSHIARFIDRIIARLAKVYPSLFSRTVVVMAKFKNKPN